MLEGRSVEQVDFEWLVEQELKPNDAVVEQLRRGFHVIERLRQFCFVSTTKTVH